MFCKKCDDEMVKKKKRWPFFILFLLLIAGIFYCTCKYEIKHFGDNRNDSTVSDNPVASNEDEIEQFEPKFSEGTAYNLNEENIKHDEDTGIDYVDNIIIIFFVEDYNVEDVAQVVEYLNGEVVGSVPELDQYQIKIHSKDYQELLKICDELSELNYVEDAFVDLVIKLDDN